MIGYHTTLYIVTLALAAGALAAPLPAPAQVIRDESKVPPYTLPDPLVMTNGQPVTTADQWRRQRRPEILELFQTQVYGRSPRRPDAVPYEVTSAPTPALNGNAIRKEIAVYMNGDKTGPTINLLIYLPANAGSSVTGPVPAFMALNFYGNQTIQPDPAITISESWMGNNPAAGVVDHHATEKSRGSMAHRWPVEMILARGYALVTAYYGDIDPDFDDGFRNGVHPLFYRAGQTKPDPDEWGSISAWAWGLSRALDYLDHDPAIDHNRVAVMGHSRLGKAALWAAAQDERFAMAISNNSGCGGAALSRRRFGETVRRINDVFPHWFCANFKRYNDHEDDLPVDQHMLIALIAPRPIYVASAEEDTWADSRGQFLSAKHAGPVYHLLGADPLPPGDMPPVNHPLVGAIAYHIRPGKHEVTEYDWKQYLTFADAKMKK